MSRYWLPGHSPGRPRRGVMSSWTSRCCTSADLPSSSPRRDPASSPTRPSTPGRTRRGAGHAQARRPGRDSRVARPRRPRVCSPTTSTPTTSTRRAGSCSPAGRVVHPDAADRLAGVVGLGPWEATRVGPVVTAVPARHGPPGAEAFWGLVTGFVLEGPGPDRLRLGRQRLARRRRAVAQRFPVVDLAVLFFGGARRPDRPEPLTLTALDAMLAGRALDARRIVPVHSEAGRMSPKARDPEPRLRRGRPRRPP